MQNLIEKLKMPLMALAMFVGGMGAAQFMQPANAQGGGGSAISAASDNSAWVVVGGKVYHCVHQVYAGQPEDRCHSM